MHNEWHRGYSIPMTATTAPASPAPIALTAVLSTPLARARNMAFRPRRAVGECLLCGKGLTARRLASGIRVHLDARGFITPATDTARSHPVGPECFYLLPPAYRA